MPTALHRFLLACLLMLPLAAHAGDAEDFLAANPSQQAKLLQDWAAQPDPARIVLVNALQQGQLTVNGEPKTVRLNNRLRGLIAPDAREDEDDCGHHLLTGERAHEEGHSGHLLARALQKSRLNSNAHESRRRR